MRSLPDVPCVLVTLMLVLPAEALPFVEKGDPIDLSFSVLDALAAVENAYLAKADDGRASRAKVLRLLYEYDRQLRRKDPFGGMPASLLAGLPHEASVRSVAGRWAFARLMRFAGGLYDHPEYASRGETELVRIRAAHPEFSDFRTNVPEVVRAYDALMERSRAELEHEIRPGGRDGSPFWNRYARFFAYPPSFDFQRDPKAVALSVNGEKLTNGAIDENVEKILKAQGDKIPPEQLAYAKQMFRQQMVQGFLIEKVLVAKATADGIKVTDEDRKNREKEFLEAVKNNPSAPKTMEEYFKKFPLGEERAKKEFENGILIDKMIKEAQKKTAAKDYKAEAKEQIAKIVAENAKIGPAQEEALKKIKELKAQLDKVPAKDIPAKFAELAKANSACPSSAKGGDLDEFQHGQMVKEFDEVAFAQPVNKVSDPVKTQFGYHLILTTKKIPAVEAKGDKPAAPEKVRASHILVKAPEAQRVPTEDEIIKYMQKNDERQFVQGYVMGLVRAAKIEASDEFKQLLPPPEEAAKDAADAAKKAVDGAAKKADGAAKKAVDAAAKKVDGAVKKVESKMIEKKVVVPVETPAKK